MNEDETTQSLSDKVIDRANVLYFGRPTKLQTKPSGNHKGKPADGFLSRKLWSKSWCKTADQPLITKYATKLDDLNALMAEVSRPFAHRTSKAILAYIANYPTENKDLAFADQIAMRIMPKLRGLDLAMYQSQLTQIQGAVSNANDRTLNAAFAKALDNKTHGFFRWQGIDWSANSEQ